MVLRRIGLAVLFGVLVGPCLPVEVQAADWPQFLGPDRNAIAPESPKLPRSWPAGGPRVLWKIPVGPGYGGAAVFGDSALILDRENNAQDVLRRIRLADGQEVWRRTDEAPGTLPHNGTRSTPATDGKTVYSIGPFGHICAASFVDGTVLWQAKLLEDWGAKLPQWGVSQNPLLYGDSLIVAPWGTKAAVVAYDKATGAVKWTTSNPGGVQLDYSSPMPLTVAGAPMLAVSGKGAYTIGVDPATGSQLWKYDGYSVKISIPSPLHVGAGRIVLTGGYGAGGAMFKVSKDGDGFSTSEVWKSTKGIMSSKIPQPILYEGFLYGNSSDDNGGLRCIALDGQVKWETGNRPGFGMGNLILVDGLIFLLNGDDGTLVMAEANPNEYKELGRASFLSGPEVWGPLAYSNGKLILRDQKTLACLDLMAVGG